MAGKAYTMREMRAIVEYLTERKAYSEIKGRKMWMEYANSEKTTRTWQSLKETFLKRILPDIQNPYYKLSMDQVRSFNQGYDVAEREKNNRLEFRTASKDSMGDNQNENEQSTTKKDNEPPATSHDNEPPTTNIDEELEKATGETITSAKISSRNRSSADTVVLEYENAEDVQRALESPKNDSNEGESKSLKDLLTFEPMTPLVRELLDDFETESEPSDKEPQLNIVENTQEIAEISESEATVKENIPAENHIKNKNLESPIEINDTDDSDRTTMNDQNTEKALTAQKEIQDKSDEPQKNKSLKLKKSENKEDNNNAETSTHKLSEITSQLDNNVTDADPKDITEFVTAESNVTTLQKSLNTDNKEDCSNIISNTGNSTQNTGNTSVDTILPNNQEALDDSKKAPQKINCDKTGADTEKLKKNGKRSGKRSSSQSSRESKKQKLADKKIKETKEDETSIPVIVINDTPTYNDTGSVLENNTKKPDSEIIEINTDTLTLNVTEEQFNALLKTVPENAVVSGTSTEKDVSIVPVNQDKNIEIVEDKNPCLLSVSLFDEQFKNTKYSDSDSDDEATPALKINKNKANPQADIKRNKDTEDKPRKKVDKNKESEVKIVENIQKKKATSVSGVGFEQQKQRTVNKTDNVVNKADNLQRERALANVFGFTHGFGASITRKRQSSHRRRSHRHCRRHSNKYNDSNSSEWTSESDSECYVSPPRGRRNRHTKKYLKPKSSHILQEPVEGMLYVTFGKKIYPLVKDGKHIKNFLTYKSDSGTDEEESYWRQKYLEEKMKVEEAKKLLKESRKNEAPVIDAPTSPILSSKSRNRSSSHSQQKPVQNGKSKDIATPPKVESKSETGDDKLVLKIATQNGLEYCLEGGWNQISNAMPQMVKMLQSETESVSPSTAKNKEPIRKRKAVEQKPSKIDDDMEISSEAPTPDAAILPIDPEVQEKVNEIEMKIFKEIEEREKEEQVKQNEAESINVTQRKPARSRKESSSSSITTSQSPAKKARTSKTSATESKQEITKSTKTKRVSKPKLDIPKEQLEHKQDEIEKPRIQTRTKIKEQQKKEKDQQSKTTTEQQTKATEQKSKTTEQQTTTTEQQTKVSQHQTEQNGSDPTVGTITLDKEQNQIINPKQPKRRESLRLSKQKETDDHNSSKGSFEGRSTRLVKTPKKYDTDSSASDTVLRSGKTTGKETTAVLGFDENTLFMFPPSTKSNKKSPRKFRSLPKTNLVTLQENTSGNSIDSTQGYQDSDASPIKIVLKKKKRISFATKNKYKNRRIIRRNSYPTLIQELSSDSNNSSYFVPTRKSQSSINSEVYRTDSFQLLVPKEKSLFNKLERIDENSPTQKFDTNKHFNNISNDSDKSTNENSNILIDIGSSIVSLPLSPELSVVENLSVSKEMIRSENHPTINEVQSNVSSHAMDFSEYMISNIDVSVPLMDQQCELRSSTDKLTPKNNAAASFHQMFNKISDQVFNKVCTVRIENLTLSETLDQRLRDLLLESSKKTTRVDNNNENAMEIDQTEITTVKKSKTRGQKKSATEGNESETTAAKKTGPHKRNENAMEVDESKNVTAKKTRAKKRSSTPQKKKTAGKQKVAKDRVIVEEHMESCSSAGRKSCPPVIIHLPVNENTNNCTDVTLNPVKLNTRKKKDVIKVKIQRPRDNSRSSVMSNNTDSGINDTGATSGLFLKDNEDSVDLIHNHSETCLLANECMGDSVEFVEDSVSIVSISSSEQSMYSELQRLLDNAANLSGELFVNSRNNSSSKQKTSEEILESPETVYHTPVRTNSSLLTEDLSDDPEQQIKWCFHSDDDTNAPPASSFNIGTFGSNLKQIFPITCAVPDLSTISEMSKENEDSRKPNFDTDGTENFDSLNLL